MKRTASATYPPGEYVVTLDQVQPSVGGFMSRFRVVPSIPMEDFMAKKKRKRAKSVNKNAIFKSYQSYTKGHGTWAEMLGPDLFNVYRDTYLGLGLKVPDDVRLTAQSQAKAFKLRKKQAMAFVAAVCSAYSQGEAAGASIERSEADKRAQADKTRHEDHLRHATRAVARAIEALVPVLKNNEAGNNGSLSIVGEG